MSDLNILHIIHGLTIGGAEMDLVTKSVALAKECHYNITFCCLMRRGELAEYVEAAQMPVIGPLMNNRYDIFSIENIRQILIRQPWSLVHSHLFAANWITFLALKTIREQHRPVFITAEHAMAQRWTSTHIFLNKLIQRQAASMLVPSKATADSYIVSGLNQTSITVMPNAINTQRFDSTAQAKSLFNIRNELNIRSEEYLIGVVCRLEPIKGLSYLLEAVRSIAAKVVIVGDGSFRPQLEAMIQKWSLGERVYLLGTRSDIPELLSSFDLFVLPSFSETFGIAIAEALLAGVPVVATRVGGIPEITDGGKYARLVEPGNVEELHAAIRWMMEHPENAKKQAEQASGFIRKNLSVENIIRKQDKFYRDVITEFS